MSALKKTRTPKEEKMDPEKKTGNIDGRKKGVGKETRYCINKYKDGRPPNPGTHSRENFVEPE